MPYTYIDPSEIQKTINGPEWTKDIQKGDFPAAEKHLAEAVTPHIGQEYTKMKEAEAVQAINEELGNLAPYVSNIAYQRAAQRVQNEIAEGKTVTQKQGLSYYRDYAEAEINKLESQVQRRQERKGPLPAGWVRLLHQ
jgi:hypothetical protein